MGGREPPVRLLGGDQVVTRLARGLAAGVLVLTGCSASGDDTGPLAEGTSAGASAGASDGASAGAPAGASDGASDGQGTASTATAARSGADSSPASSPPVPPPERACYRLTLRQVLAAVTRAPSSPCTRPHTARTFAVGEVADLVDGPVRSIDAPRVQRAVAVECPRRLATFVGGPEQALRLSMFRSVWFTPTLPEAEDGAAWYRCDIVALAAEGTLAHLIGRLEGVLGRSAAWKATYGLCATAEPGTAGFERVACARSHTWRAVSTVPIPGERYPGVVAVRALGTAPCTDAARNVADDALDFRWGYEWPSLEQWRSGRRYGVCWAPAP